jgi:hypothetical protein
VSVRLRTAFKLSVKLLEQLRTLFHYLRNDREGRKYVRDLLELDLLSSNPLKVVAAKSIEFPDKLFFQHKLKHLICVFRCLGAA